MITQTPIGTLCPILPFIILPTQDHMTDPKTYWYTDRSRHLLVHFVKSYLSRHCLHRIIWRIQTSIGTLCPILPANTLPTQDYKTDSNTYWYNDRSRHHWYTLSNLTFQGIAYTGSHERYRHLLVHFVQSYLSTSCLHRIT